MQSRHIFLGCCLVVSIFLCNINLQAQLYIGPKVGGHINFLTQPDWEYWNDFALKPTINLNAGLSALYFYQEKLAFVTELYYTQKGRVVDRVGQRFVEHQANFNYLEAPLLFRYYFGKYDQGFQFYINAGPSFQYLMKAEGSLRSNETEDIGWGRIHYDYVFNEEASLIDRTWAMPNVNRLQLGLDIGAGLQLNLINEDLFIVDFRFHAGHTHISKQRDGGSLLLDYEDNFRQAFRSLAIQVYYLKHIKIKERKKGKSTRG